VHVGEGVGEGGGGGGGGGVGDVGAAAAWVTVKFQPAASIVPVRVEVTGLAATLYETVPGPVADAPAVTLIQLD